MIGAIIACDHAETAHPRLLEGERRLAAGFGRPFPFDDSKPVASPRLPRGWCPGIVRKGGAAVELQALQEGKQAQCLNEIHLQGNTTLDPLPVDRQTIRAIRAIELKLGAEHTIRSSTGYTVPRRDFAICDGSFSHCFSPVCFSADRMAEAGGTEQPLGGGSEPQARQARPGARSDAAAGRVSEDSERAAARAGAKT